LERRHYCFNGREEEGGEVTVDGMIILKVGKFKYLGLIIKLKGDIDKDIKMKVCFRCAMW